MEQKQQEAPAQQEELYPALRRLAVPEEDLRQVMRGADLTRDQLEFYAEEQFEKGRAEQEIREDYTELARLYRENEAKPLYCAVPASSFTEHETRFVWKPYLPEGEFTVMMAPGGTGKTYFACAIAAALSNGEPLPGETAGRAPERVLMISAEDEGSILRGRLRRCGADLERVMLLDSQASQGLCLSEEYEDFRAAVLAFRPRLVVVDPWHAFLGAAADMNRANTVRPIFQKLSNLCKECGCAMLLLAHVNKKLQTENINNAAMGSADLVNAARSVLYLIRDPEDDGCRVAVHSKANYAAEGKSLRLRIENGGADFAGYSDVTKEELESANRSHRSLKELRRAAAEQKTENEALADALCALCNPFAPVRMSYQELEKRCGGMIYAGRQPKRALDAVKSVLEERGVFLRTGIQLRQEGKRSKGFLLQSIPDQPEQQGLFDEGEGA